MSDKNDRFVVYAKSPEEVALEMTKLLMPMPFEGYEKIAFLNLYSECLLKVKGE